MKIIRIFCISSILLGINLFLLSSFLMPDSSHLLPWCLGLASAMIILGSGYFLNTFLTLPEQGSVKRPKNGPNLTSPVNAKEKAGYLVCKLMNILLCIYLLILNELHADSVILFLSIALVLVQYCFDLLLQLYFTNRNNRDK